MQKNLVVKDNSLLNAAYRLSIAEQRLILLAIADARNKGLGIDEKSELKIHASSYSSAFKVTPQAAYIALKEGSQNLIKRTFSYDVKGKNGHLRHATSNWVQYVDYSESEASIKLIFATKVVPLITRLEKHFSSYELEQVAELSSVYAIRLYELLMGWKSIGKTPVFELEEFRLKLGVEEGIYLRMHSFKERVLDFAIMQINNNTDIFVNYEQHKSGRKITGFSFSFKYKSTAILADSTRCDKTLELPLDKPLTEKQIGYYAKLLANSSWSGQARILIGVEAKDVISVIMRHLKNPEFVAKNYTAIQKLLNKKGK